MCSRKARFLLATVFLLFPLTVPAELVQPWPSASPNSRSRAPALASLIAPHVAETSVADFLSRDAPREEADLAFLVVGLCYRNYGAPTGPPSSCLAFIAVDGGAVVFCLHADPLNSLGPLGLEGRVGGRRWQSHVAGVADGLLGGWELIQSYILLGKPTRWLGGKIHTGLYRGGTWLLKGEEYSDRVGTNTSLSLLYDAAGPEAQRCRVTMDDVIGMSVAVVEDVGLDLAFFALAVPLDGGGGASFVNDSAGSGNGIVLRVYMEEGFDATEFNRKVSRLRRKIEQGKAYAKIPHRVSKSQRKKVTRAYRRALENRVRAFYADNPEAMSNALDRLATCDIDHILDLQLSGANTTQNLKSLDSATNQGVGRQISTQLPRDKRVRVVGIEVLEQ